MDYSKLGISDDLLNAVKSVLSEKEMHPNQKVLDKNKNGKLDADDFKKLRGESSCDDKDEDELEEAIDTVKKDASGKVVSWSREGDWEPKSNKNKQGAGKAANLAGQALQKTKELTKEEVEELDELSKTTLGSYVKKASNSLSKASHDLGDKRAQSAEVDRFTNRHMGDKFRVQGKMKDDLGIGNKAQEKDLNTVLKRTRGITKAADKLTKEELAKDREHWQINQPVRRTRGITSAANKLTKEELEEYMQTEAYEQLDELSKNTLKSYVGKAVQSHGKNRVMANMAWDKSEEPGDLLDKLGHKSLKDSKKRSIGIAKAVDKLTKEQYEEIEALAAKHGLGE